MAIIENHSSIHLSVRLTAYVAAKLFLLKPLVHIKRKKKKKKATWMIIRPTLGDFWIGTPYVDNKRTDKYD